MLPHTEQTAFRRKCVSLKMVVFTFRFYMIVKPMFAISIFVSFNVQFYVPVKIFMARLINCRCIDTSTQKGKDRLESVLRVCLVVLTSK